MQHSARKRKSIFELERRTDLNDDLENLYDEFENVIVTDSHLKRSTLYTYLDKAIRDWPFRQAATNIEGFLDQHGIDEEKEDLSTNLFILELYINLLHWAPKHDAKSVGLMDFDSDQNITKECNRILENIDFILEQNNYCVRENYITNDDEHIEFMISKRDADVDATLEVAPELSETLLSYLDVRNSNNEDFKRSALKQIADYMEHKRKKYKGTSYAQLCDDVFTVFNKCNIRHNNPEFKKIRKPKRMRIYDTTFKMTLHLMQMDDVNRYKEEISSLKAQLDQLPNK